MSSVLPSARFKSAIPRGESRDFLARCVTGRTGNLEKEKIREKGADAVLALYRLVKVALMHAADNDAVGRAIEQSHAILRDFAVLAGGTVSVTFMGDMIFVSGQLLRASRMVYDSASELGSLFARCGVSEVAIGSGVARQDLAALTGVMAVALREPDQAPAVIAQPIPNIALRKVDSILAREAKDEGGARPEGEFLRLYASALVVMRRFFDAVASGSTVLPHRVKRLAQAFVGLSEMEDAGLLGLTAMANAHRDDAGRAVQSAILSLAIGRLLTQDRVTLARLALGAMMADVGRVRLAGSAGRDRLVKLGDRENAAVPAVTSALCIASGGVNAQSAHRTVTVFEATWLEREAELGALYGDAMTPLLETRILHVARAMLERLAPRDTAKGLSALDALQSVARDTSIDRDILRLLVRAIGLTPIGSVVELETGEWAVVVAPSDDPSAHDRPRVRVLMDNSGRAREPPLEVDLGVAPPGKPYPRIVRVVDPAEARFNVARAFIRR